MYASIPDFYVIAQEIKRSHELLSAGVGLAQVCAPLKREPGFLPKAPDRLR